MEKLETVRGWRRLERVKITEILGWRGWRGREAARMRWDAE